MIVLLPQVETQDTIIQRKGSANVTTLLHRMVCYDERRRNLGRLLCLFTTSHVTMAKTVVLMYSAIKWSGFKSNLDYGL